MPFELIFESNDQSVIQFIFKHIDLSPDCFSGELFKTSFKRICEKPNMMRIFVKEILLKEFANNKLGNSYNFFQFIFKLIMEKDLQLEILDEIINQAREIGLDLNVANSWLNNSVFPPLHFAAKKGDLNCIKKLLSYGANPSISSRQDNATALHIAASFGYGDCVKELLESGANPFAKNSDGKTPIDIATGEALSILLPCYFKELEKKSVNSDILNDAIEKGDQVKIKQILELISKHPKLLLSKNEHGLTPFELALQKRQYKIAELLFEFNKNYIGGDFIPGEKSNTLYRCLRDKNRQQLIIGSNTSSLAFEVYNHYLDRLKRKFQITVASAIKFGKIDLLGKMVLQIPFCFTFFNRSYLEKITNNQKLPSTFVNLIKEAFGLSPLGLSLYYLKHNDKDQLRVIPFLLSLSPKLLRYQDILKAATEGTLGVFQTILIEIESQKIKEACQNLGICKENLENFLRQEVPRIASYHTSSKRKRFDSDEQQEIVKRLKGEELLSSSKEEEKSDSIELLSTCKEMDLDDHFFDHQKFLVKVDEIFDSPEHIPHINRREIPFLKLINSEGNTVLHQLILKYDLETLKKNEKLLRTLLKVIDSVLIEEPQLANIKNDKNQTPIELADDLSLDEISQSMKFRLKKIFTKIEM